MPILLLLGEPSWRLPGVECKALRAASNLSRWSQPDDRGVQCAKANPAASRNTPVLVPNLRGCEYTVS
ncbi:hypothetical protein AC579_7266 [Pseudocercospora musae]|uniref:Uncharacterized protein n=1 Tax=Pseudocercospora musae TaxID=113226 RepID=A0A139I379_9PEZI|nr:hypothetical protein AC579_7266 [Pseudocercospora musae]